MIPFNPEAGFHTAAAELNGDELIAAGIAGLVYALTRRPVAGMFGDVP